MSILKLETEKHVLAVDQEEHYSIDDFLFNDSSEIFITNVPRYIGNFNSEYSLNDFETLQEAIDHFKTDDNKCYIVNAYIHSGIALSLSNDSYPFNCQWDSGIAGLLFLSKDYNAESFIKEWNLLLEGSVYYYSLEEKITCEHCNNVELEHVDSLGYIVADSMEDLIDDILDNISIDNAEIIENLNGEK